MIITVTIDRKRIAITFHMEIHILNLSIYRFTLSTRVKFWMNVVSYTDRARACRILSIRRKTNYSQGKKSKMITNFPPSALPLVWRPFGPNCFNSCCKVSTFYTFVNIYPFSLINFLWNTTDFNVFRMPEPPKPKLKVVVKGNWHKL